MNLLPDNYQSLSGGEKQATLWANVLATAYSDTALPNMGMVRFVLRASANGLFSVGHLRKSFLHPSDEMPPGRVKIVHPFGSVCCVRFEATDGHPFTGLFRSGAAGLMRIGLALPSKEFTPGLGLKLFLDGRPSANVVVIPNLMGQGSDHNVFARRGSNVLPPFHGLMLNAIKVMFRRAVRTISSTDLSWDRMPLDHVAAMTADGQPEKAPVVPYEMVLEPSAQAHVSSAPEPDYRIKLKALRPGTLLYVVSARAGPNAELLRVGTIRSSSEFVASSYGDTRLFFQHDVGNPPPGAPT